MAGGGETSTGEDDFESMAEQDPTLATFDSVGEADMALRSQGRGIISKSKRLFVSVDMSDWGGLKKPRLVVVDEQDFVCPICMDIMASAIVQCGNGHAVCDTCQKMARDPGVCGVCRWDGTMSPCRHLEAMIKSIDFGCPYADRGCTFTGSAAAIEGHSRVCSRFPVRCPTCMAPVTLGNCASHMQQEHMLSCNDATTLPTGWSQILALDLTTWEGESSNTHWRPTNAGRNGDAFTLETCCESPSSTLPGGGGVVYATNVTCDASVLSFCLVHVRTVLLRPRLGEDGERFRVRLTVKHSGEEQMRELAIVQVRCKDFWADRGRAETSFLKPNCFIHLGAMEARCAQEIHVSVGPCET